VGGQNVVHRFEDWVGLEDHSGAAAKLVIVGGPVRVVGVGPDVGDFYSNQSPLAGQAHHAGLQGRLENFGEEG